MHTSLLELNTIMFKHQHSSYSCIDCRKQSLTTSFANHEYYTHQHIYPKIPKLFGSCKQCHENIIGYGKGKERMFCNSSCAATYNNNQRDYAVFTPGPKSQAKKIKIPKIKGRVPNPSYTKISLCKNCNTWFTGWRKTCSDACLSKHLSKTAKTRTGHSYNKSSIEYNGVKLGSGYELIVAQSLDDNNIQWIRPGPFKYLDLTGNNHQYFPDFYLPEYDVYLDPKNDYLINNPNPYHGYKDVDKIKWAEQYNNIRVLVLDKTQLDWSTIKTMVGTERLELSNHIPGVTP